MSPRPIEFDDAFRIVWPSQPAISPDGRRVAFVVSQLDEGSDSIRYRILCVDAAGGEPRTVAEGARSPVWLPDGRLVVNAGGELSIVDVDSGGVRPLAEAPAGAHSVSPSPDGRSIVFVAPSRAPAREAGPYTVGPRYKVDGVGIVPDQPPGHLWRIDVDGTRLQQLTDAPADDLQPRVSPDGRWVAFRSMRGLGPFASVSGIWIVPFAGGEARQIVDPAGQVRILEWSPDGRRIAWIGHRRGEVHGINFGLFVVDVADGQADGEVRELGAELDRSIGLIVRADPPGPFTPPDLAWAPDGASLYATVLEGGTSPLVRFGLDDAVEQVAGGRRAVHAFAAAATGRLAILTADATSPGQVAVIDDGQERTITDLNAEWLRGVSLGRQERLEFTAEDGQPLEAWLLHPSSRPADARLPLVLQVHGGPHWALGERFQFDPRRLAEAGGFRVLLMNPRGAQGYGEAYATVNRGDWGGIDARDLLRAVEVVAARPDVDPERVGVYGESYGGFMTPWLVATTDRFRAAVAQSVIVDLASETLTTDDPPGMAFELMGMPWEQPERYRRLSPITHVQGITAPVLIIHSEADQNCPINQAEQFHAALVQLGRTVEFLRLPGEGHLINLVGRPSSRRARAEAMDRWFAEHL